MRSNIPISREEIKIRMMAKHHADLLSRKKLIRTYFVPYDKPKQN